MNTTSMSNVMRVTVVAQMR